MKRGIFKIQAISPKNSCVIGYVEHLSQNEG